MQAEERVTGNSAVKSTSSEFNLVMICFQAMLAYIAYVNLKGIASVLGACFVILFFYGLPRVRGRQRKQTVAALGVTVVAVAQIAAIYGERSKRSTAAATAATKAEAPGVQNSATPSTPTSTADTVESPKPTSEAERKKEAEEGIKDRVFYAKTFENYYLMRGQSVTVTTSGAERRVLTLRYPLITKATVYQFHVANQDDLNQMEIEGFKKFIMANGEEMWTFDLKPRQ